MTGGIKFTAPWETPLLLTTVFSVILLVGIAMIGLIVIAPLALVWGLFVAALTLLPLAVAALCAIRGYELTPDSLYVQRLGWRSTLSLTTLRTVHVDPEATADSVRVFGNGGLFCFTGTFANDRLGTYRAFGTDRKRTVVLKFVERTVVITPGDPHGFVAKTKKLRKL
ncbi:MAG: PH domain-containing protein [Verrucomicrobiota bacterium]